VSIAQSNDDREFQTSLLNEKKEQTAQANHGRMLSVLTYVAEKSPWQTCRGHWNKPWSVTFEDHARGSVALAGPPYW
jgi:hypothetical protein